MKIGIDITFLKDQYSRRGIGTYGKELTRNLIINQDINFVLFGFDDFKSNLNLLNIKRQDNIKFVSLGKSRKSNVLNPLIFKLFYKRKILKEKPDFYFAPHFERGLPIGKIKTAVMIHDVIPLLTKSFSSSKGFVNKLKEIFYKYNLNNAKKADIIFTNSEFSKRELVEKAGFNENKIIPIYLGVKDIFRESNIDKDNREIRRILLLYKVSKPYILYYGGIEANKNVVNLLHSYKNVLKRFPDLKLVIVGKEFKIGWDGKVNALNNQAREILNLSEELKLKHSLIFTGEVDNEHLPLILNNSEAFVHLSEYEGFGFSVLEAMACGIPTIAARKSCYPEILKESTFYVDPKDHNSVSNGIINVIEDEKIRKDLIKKGLQLSSNYTWSKTSEKTLTTIINSFNEIPKLNIGALIINFYPIKGGAEQNCLNISRECVNNGHNVRVMTSLSSNNHKVNDEYQGIKIIRFKKKNNKYYLSFYPELFKYLINNKFDIIHVHGFGFLWHDFCLIIKKIISPNTIIINTPHGPFMAHGNYSKIKKILKKLFTIIQRIYLNLIYSKVIAVNPLQKEWLNKEYGISLNKIEYIPNSIPHDFNIFEEDNKFVEENSLKKKYIISFIGRYEKYKGLQDLIKAVIKIKENNKNIYLYAIGNSGRYLNELKELIIKNNASKYINLLESPPTKILKTVLKYSKIFVLPSSWEAFGISILEAMSFGNTIISTRTEGVDLLVKDGINGYLYDYGNVDDLTFRLNEIITNKPLAMNMKEVNLKKWKEYTNINLYIKYKDMLVKLLNEKK